MIPAVPQSPLEPPPPPLLVELGVPVVVVVVVVVAVVADVVVVVVGGLRRVVVVVVVVVVVPPPLPGLPPKPWFAGGTVSAGVGGGGGTGIPMPGTGSFPLSSGFVGAGRIAPMSQWTFRPPPSKRPAPTGAGMKPPKSSTYRNRRKSLSNAPAPIAGRAKGANVPGAGSALS
jgi:hypothetical protein